MNPIYDMLQGTNMPPIVQQFLKFRQSFTGDPKAQVERMLQSGQISQEQYNAAVQRAQQLKQMLGPGGHR